MNFCHWELILFTSNCLSLWINSTHWIGCFILSSDLRRQDSLKFEEGDMCSPHRQYQEHKIRITWALSSWILIQHQAPTRSHSDTYYTQLSQNFVWLSKTTTLTLKSFIVGLCNYWSEPPKCMSFLDYKMSSFFSVCFAVASRSVGAISVFFLLLTDPWHFEWDFVFGNAEP